MELVRDLTLSMIYSLSSYTSSFIVTVSTSVTVFAISSLFIKLSLSVAISDPLKLNCVDYDEYTL